MRSVFTYAVFGDRRLVRRCATVWQDYASLFNALGSGESVKETQAKRKGAKRLFANEDVDTTLAEREGTQFTLATTQGMRRVIAMHDSSEFNLSGRYEPDDGGPLRSSNARGYMLHAVLLIDAEAERPRGFVYTQAWRRSWDLKHNDQSRPPHRKESYKWKRGLKGLLQTIPDSRTWIHVMDREGDLYENFEYAVREQIAVIIGVRSDKRILEGTSRSLWSFMRHQPVLDERELEMRSSATGARATRKLSIRAAQVTLTPVKKFAWQRKRVPLVVNVIYVRAAPSEPEWMLITTCPVDDVAAAWRVFGDYCLRTLGEDGFKLLKTGFELESEPISDITAFRRKVALLLPLATCLLEWRHRAISEPNTPAAEHVDADTLEALAVVAKWHRIDVPRGRWTIAAFVECIAQIGGFERRKGHPGWITIWRGWRVFQQQRRIRELALHEARSERA